MGYCIEMVGSNFSIKKEHFEEALKSLKSVFVSENMTSKNYINGREYPHFRWVHTNTILSSTTLEEALKGIRYTSTFDSNGNICDVEFIGEKYGDEKIFFTALAPYVEPDSYLCFEGEDGEVWKWIFRNGEIEHRKWGDVVVL